MLHPTVRGKCERFLAECAKAGLRILVTETYRSNERQEALYAQGRTAPGAVVTSVKSYGAHYFGVAFDFVPLDALGKANYKAIEAFRSAGEIGKGLGLEWGGDWKNPVDMPHFQQLGGVSLAQYRAGKRPAWYGKWTPGAGDETAGGSGTEDEGMTQEQFNVMLDKALAAREAAREALPPSDWAQRSWGKATKGGVFLNDTPQGMLTREQLAEVLDRLGMLP